MRGEIIEFISKEDTNCGKVWPWSKKRFTWQLRIDGQTVGVEATCSWRSEKCRIALNGAITRYGSLLGLKEYEFFFMNLPLSVKIVGHCADLLVDGVPADWFTQTMRTQQESLFQSIQYSLPFANELTSPRDYAFFVDAQSVYSESTKRPLLTL
jgi:hypothetical protein